MRGEQHTCAWCMHTRLRQTKTHAVRLGLRSDVYTCGRKRARDLR